MIKLIKWDVLDFIHRRWLILAGMVIATLLILLPANGSDPLNAFLIVCSALIGLITFIALLSTAALIPFHWLMRESSLLERSLPFAGWKLLLSKFILSVLLNLLACLFILQLSLFHGRFASGQLTILTAENLGGLTLISVTLLLADVSLAFIYILAKSMPFLKRASILVASLIGLLIFASYFILTVPIMIKAGALALPTISFQNVFTLNGNNQVFKPTLLLVFGLVLIMIEFVLCSELLKRRFRKD